MRAHSSVNRVSPSVPKNTEPGCPQLHRCEQRQVNPVGLNSGGTCQVQTLALLTMQQVWRAGHSQNLQVQLEDLGRTLLSAGNFTLESFPLLFQTNPDTSSKL